MSSFWLNFHHWLHWKLSKWQLPVQPMIKISSKWRHFRFSDGATVGVFSSKACMIKIPVMFCKSFMDGALSTESLVCPKGPIQWLTMRQPSSRPNRSSIRGAHTISDMNLYTSPGILQGVKSHLLWVAVVEFLLFGGGLFQEGIHIGTGQGTVGHTHFRCGLLISGIVIVRPVVLIRQVPLWGNKKAALLTETKQNLPLQKVPFNYSPMP